MDNQIKHDRPRICLYTLLVPSEARLLDINKLESLEILTDKLCCRNFEDVKSLRTAMDIFKDTPHKIIQLFINEGFNGWDIMTEGTSFFKIKNPKNCIDEIVIL